MAAIKKYAHNDSWRFKINIHFLLACSLPQREVIAAALAEEKKTNGQSVT